VEENKARDLYEAITEEKSGILTWLKKFREKMKNPANMQAYCL